MLCWLGISKLVQAFDNAVIHTLGRSEKMREGFPALPLSTVEHNQSMPHADSRKLSSLRLLGHGHVLIISSDVVDYVFVLQRCYDTANHSSRPRLAASPHISLTPFSMMAAISYPKAGS